MHGDMLKDNIQDTFFDSMVFKYVWLHQYVDPHQNVWNQMPVKDMQLKHGDLVHTYRLDYLRYHMYIYI